MELNKTPRSLLLLYPKDTMELLNRRSALGSYLFILCSILEKEGYKIQVNDVLFKDLSKMPARINAGQGKRSFVARLIPGVIKNLLRDVLQFRRYKELGSAILNTSFKPDIILDFYSYGSDLGYVIQHKLKVPRLMVFDAPVVEEHQFFHGYSPLKSFMFGLQKKNLRAASAIVVYSNAVKEYVHNITGGKERVFIHQNVDFSRFEFIEPRQKEGRINICFIGSFLKWHRIDLLLEVFGKLANQLDNIHLFLVGDGMERENMTRLASDIPAKERITFTGFLDGTGLFDLKKEMHVGVMPGSNWYGAPNKIFEYGAAGLAVVAPDTPTIKDLFKDEVELMMFRQDNFKDFYEKLYKVCVNLSVRKMLAHNLQDTIRNRYSEKNTFAFYDGIFTKLMNK